VCHCSTKAKPSEVPWEFYTLSVFLSYWVP